MNTIHHVFLSLWLAAVRYELAIARSTGRDPAHVAALSQQVTDIEGDIHRLEVRYG